MMNIQGFYPLTLLDFPGRLACEVFVGGCNLRCPFCHNASLVLQPNENENKEKEVWDLLQKRRGVLTGVCISGGEPLLQADLADFVAKVRALGYAVKLDTNGALPEKLGALLSCGLLDYVAMDVKNAPMGYAVATGGIGNFEPFAESIRLLQESGVPHEFRTTVVGGIHTPQDVGEIAAMLGDVLYYIQPFSDKGSVLNGGICRSVSDGVLAEMLAAARQYAPRAEIRGRELK